jgi:hypothetical protein
MKQLFVLSLLIVAGACASAGDRVAAPGQSSASASYSVAYAAAVAAIEYSVARGHAWSTSDALLQQAVAADADGDEDLAIELADAARVQAELAAKQADIEEGTWQERVLSN